jgi:CDP-diacylglycerol--glycerol-3-phosphate 3-phosphatidyltransferase
MNLPNKLTTCRVAFSFVFMYLLWARFPGSMFAAWIIFVAAVASDFLDGWLARRGHGVTDYGKLMDPVADKMIICAAFVSFVQLPATHVPVWMVVIIISREFIVTSLRLLALSHGQVLAAGLWGKHKTVSQVAAILVILTFLAMKDIAALLGIGDSLRPFYDPSRFASFVFWVMMVTVTLTVGSGLIYLYENRGLFWEGKR